MRKFVIFCFSGFFLVGIIAWAWAVYCAPKLGGSTVDVIDQYQKYARTPIFTGFLTMGSFLLAMKTNILSRLKEAYDTEEHKRTYLHINEGVSPDKRSEFYSGLHDLSKAIACNVIFCLVTALLQMTLGFYPHISAFVICIGTAGACLFLLIYLTWILLTEHDNWFKAIEEKALKELYETK